MSHHSIADQPGKGGQTMSLHRWLQNLRSALAPRRGQRQHARPGLKRAPTHRPSLEVLEDRSVPAFVAPIDYAVGNGVFDMKVGDFNNDGRADLVTANYHDDSVSVLLGNDDGTFQPAQSPAIARPTSLAVGDLDGDGNLDLVTADDETLSLLRGQGDGTFGPP